MAESVYSWNAACIRMCHSGVIWLRGHEHPLPLRRHLVEVDVPVLGDPLHQRSEYQPSRLGDGDEVLVHVRHQHAGLVAHERHGEQRLDARLEQPAMIEIVPVGATVVTLQLRSRRIGRMRSPVCVARAGRVRAPDAPLPLGERAALLGQPLRFDLRLLVHELHHLAAQLDRLRRSRRRCRGARAGRPSPSRRARCGGSAWRGRRSPAAGSCWRR